MNNKALTLFPLSIFLWLLIRIICLSVQILVQLFLLLLSNVFKHFLKNRSSCIKLPAPYYFHTARFPPFCVGNLCVFWYRFTHFCLQGISKIFWYLPLFKISIFPWNLLNTLWYKCSKETYEWFTVVTTSIKFKVVGISSSWQRDDLGEGRMPCSNHQLEWQEINPSMNIGEYAGWYAQLFWNKILLPFRRCHISSHITENTLIVLKEKMVMNMTGLNEAHFFWTQIPFTGVLLLWGGTIYI